MVKRKILIIGGLLVIVTALSVFNRDNEEDRFVVWNLGDEIDESYFYSIPPLFKSRFDATIRVNILLEKDSFPLQSSTVIDKYDSWLRGDSYSEELLRHESYHANIFEIYTRMLNKLIFQRNITNVYKAQFLRDSIFSQAHYENLLYDKETDHGLNRDFQNYWEYKVDSTLYEYPEIIDYYSGASARFPFKPKEIFIQSTKGMTKCLELEKYDLKFRFATYYDDFRDSAELFLHAKEQLDGKFSDIEVKSFKWFNNFCLETECTDTVYQRKFYDRFIIKDSRIYHLTFTCPSYDFENPIYQRLMTQFFESFKIYKTNKYWIDKYLKTTPSEIYIVSVTKETTSEEIRTIYYDWKISTSDLIYQMPIKYEDKFLIPFKIPFSKNTIDSFESIMFIVNKNDIYELALEGDEQILAIPSEFLKEGKNKIKFGYSIKRDSIGDRLDFFGSNVEILK
jgi:hypothetical protein